VPIAYFLRHEADSKEMELMLLEYHHPGECPILAGVFLHSSKTGELEFRVRRAWPEVLDPVDREYLEQADETFRSFQRDMGNAGLLKFLEQTLSNLLRLSSRLELNHDATEIAQLADRLAELLLSPPAG
jgi:hypothetical protein